ncbi:hypothetical protein ABZS76_32840 [Streptomyces sp. NPDC005562]|uniref:hypothetical protein n=1 Tax=Streptomyces sp. NPDC005562 TaxID=3154890 RepID=UPI0033AB7167
MADDRLNVSTHAQCFEVSQTPDGHDVACRKSKGHDAKKPKREREHFDPSANARWKGDDTARVED